MGCGSDGQKEASDVDDLRGIGYGSGHFQEDDEVSGRRVRPGQGAPLPTGSVGSFFLGRQVEN